MSPLCRAIAAALFLVGTSMGTSLSFADSPQPRRPPGIAEAPIGHRQPSAADVPADDSVTGSPQLQAKAPLSAAQRNDDRKAGDIIARVCSAC
jgi:hypothetical protein